MREHMLYNSWDITQAEIVFLYTTLLDWKVEMNTCPYLGFTFSYIGHMPSMPE